VRDWDSRPTGLSAPAERGCLATAGTASRHVAPCRGRLTSPDCRLRGNRPPGRRWGVPWRGGVGSQASRIASGAWVPRNRGHGVASCGTVSRSRGTQPPQPAVLRIVGRFLRHRQSAPPSVAASRCRHAPRLPSRSCLVAGLRVLTGFPAPDSLPARSGGLCRDVPVDMPRVVTTHFATAFLAS